MDVQTLLRAYDQQLRTDAETQNALSVTHLSLLRLVTFNASHGFVTYPHPDHAEATELPHLLPRVLDYYRQNPTITQVEWKTRNHEGRNPYERLHLLVAGVLEAHGEYMEFYQLLVNTLQDERIPTALRSAIQDYGERFGSFLRRLIIAGQAAGEIAEGDPKQLETALRGCLNGLSKMAVIGQLVEQADFPTPDIVLRLVRK